MESLQTVALGLLLVFLDVGGDQGVDWVADPVGWVLVIVGLVPALDRLVAGRALLWTAAVCLVVSLVTFPPDSLARVDPSAAWAFSLPTLVWCWWVSGALADAVRDPWGRRFRILRMTFVVVALLPVLIYGPGWTWLALPAALLAVCANVTLLVGLWAASAPEALADPADPDAAEV